MSGPGYARSRPSDWTNENNSEIAPKNCTEAPMTAISRSPLAASAATCGRESRTAAQRNFCVLYSFLWALQAW